MYETPIMSMFIYLFICWGYCAAMSVPNLATSLLRGLWENTNSNCCQEIVTKHSPTSSRSISLITRSHSGALTISLVNTAESHVVMLDTAMEDQPHIYIRLQQDVSER